MLGHLRVARGHQLGAGLEEVSLGGGLADVAAAVDREDRADGHVDVDVGRAVERVETNEVVAGLASDVGLAELVLLLARQRADHRQVVEQRDQQVVGDRVELGDLLALDVGVPGLAQHVGQAGAVDVARDDLGRGGDVAQQDGEVAAGSLVFALPLQDVPREGDEIGHRTLRGRRL